MKSNYSSKETRKFLDKVLNNHFELSKLLSNDELENLEFIMAFGMDDFIKASDTRVLEKLSAFCKSITATMSFIDILPANTLLGYSRCDTVHSRAERRAANANKKTRIINLGSDDIYLVDKSLIRHCGTVYHRVKDAKKLLENFSPKCETPDIISLPIKYSKREKYLRILKHGKRLVYQAEIYRFHVAYSAAQCRYFENAKLQVAVLPEA